MSEPIHERSPVANSQLLHQRTVSSVSLHGTVSPPWSMQRPDFLRQCEVSFTTAGFVLYVWLGLLQKFRMRWGEGSTETSSHPWGQRTSTATAFHYFIMPLTLGPSCNSIYPKSLIQRVLHVLFCFYPFSIHDLCWQSVSCPYSVEKFERPLNPGRTCSTVASRPITSSFTGRAKIQLHQGLQYLEHVDRVAAEAALQHWM